MKLLRRFAGWLRPKLPYLNIILVLGCYVGNEYYIQGFCQPVPWVWWVLGPTLGAFLAWPWLKQVPRLNYGLLFLQGTFLLACLYCALFVGPYLFMGLLFGLMLFPLLLWTPVVLLMQVLGRAWRSPLPGARRVFGAGMLPLLLAQGWAWGQYRQVVVAVASLPPRQRNQAEFLWRVTPRTYMAERLAGALFKYHNYPEFIYDGWRPPLHDPLVNVCLHVGAWTQELVNPLIVPHWQPGTAYYAGFWSSDINSQVSFYHRLFPTEPVKTACACSYTRDAQGYFAWKPGLTDNLGTSLVEVARQQRESDAEMAWMQARSTADSLRAISHPTPP